MFAIVALIVILFVYNSNNTNEIGTKLEFVVKNNPNSGFSYDREIYINENLTLIGEISVDKTAELKIISLTDNSIAYSKEFVAIKNQELEIKLEDLNPNSTYKIIFSSESSKNANLLLNSNEKLVKDVDKPRKPVPSKM